MSKRKLSFEEALERLESLAEEIEEGKVGLEASITKYEEGMKLIQQCRQMLTQAEQRIQKLQEQADGTLEAPPMKRPKPE